jgi:hypothetical protein
VPTLLNDMPLERASGVFLHPLHQNAYRDLAQLILALRQCRKYEDYYHFQQDLLGRVLAAQEHRAACNRVVRRLRSCKGVPADAPDLRSGAPDSLEDWELEVDVCERVDRQLRSIGDALAWRVFNYDRQVIVALSRNASVTPMVGEQGLAAERQFLTRTWEEERSFVLMHDLTTCLRIGDATEFKSVGKKYEAYLHEIKTDPNRRRSSQLQRKRLAEEAIRDHGPLPGDPDARLVALNIVYKTHLDVLRSAFETAATKGVVARKVPGGRVLLAANHFKGYELWSEEEYLERTAEVHYDECQRARLLEADNLIHVRSDDTVGRSPTVPPWAMYPLDPVTCASLIADLAFFSVTISSKALVDALCNVGLIAEWLQPIGIAELPADEDLIRIHNRVRVSGLRLPEVRRVALELVELSIWAKGVKELFDKANEGQRAWHYFAREGKVWA